MIARGSVGVDGATTLLLIVGYAPLVLPVEKMLWIHKRAAVHRSCAVLARPTLYYCFILPNLPSMSGNGHGRGRCLGDDRVIGRASVSLSSHLQLLSLIVCCISLLRLLLLSW